MPLDLKAVDGLQGVRILHSSLAVNESAAHEVSRVAVGFKNDSMVVGSGRFRAFEDSHFDAWCWGELAEEFLTSVLLKAPHSAAINHS